MQGISVIISTQIGSLIKKKAILSMPDRLSGKEVRFPCQVGRLMKRKASFSIPDRSSGKENEDFLTRSEVW